MISETRWGRVLWLEREQDKQIRDKIVAKIVQCEPAFTELISCLFQVGK